MSDNTNIKNEIDTNLEKMTKENGFFFTDIDRYIKDGAFQKAADKLGGLMVSQANNPGLYLRLLLCKYNESSIAHYIYENRKEPAKIKAVFAQPEWASLKASLSEEDAFLAIHAEHFYDLCDEEERIRKAGPSQYRGMQEEKAKAQEAQVSASDETNQQEAPVEKTAVQEVPLLTRFFKRLWNFILAIRPFLIFVLFCVLVIGGIVYIQKEFGERKDVIMLFYLFAVAYFGFIYLYARTDFFQDRRNVDTKKEYETQKEFNAALRKLEDRKWNTYKKLEEAEALFKKREHTSARVAKISPEQKGMLGKTCSNCGSNMSFDASTKRLVCPFCGKTQSMSDTDGITTIKDVKLALAQERYSKASILVVELLKKKPDDLELLLISLRCSLRTPTISEGLHERRNNPAELQRVLDQDEWDKLQEIRPNGDVAAFTRMSKQYCERNMRLLGKEPRKPGDEPEEARPVQDDSDKYISKRTVFLFIAGIIIASLVLLSIFPENFVIILVVILITLGFFFSFIDPAAVDNDSTYVFSPLSAKDIREFDKDFNKKEDQRKKMKKQQQEKDQAEAEALEELYNKIKDLERNL